MYSFLIGGQYDGLDGLCIHYPDNVFPIMVDVFLFEHMPDGINQLVGQDRQIKMCFNTLILFGGIPDGFVSRI